MLGVGSVGETILAAEKLVVVKKNFVTVLFCVPQIRPRDSWDGTQAFGVRFQLITL